MGGRAVVLTIVVTLGAQPAFAVEADLRAGTDVFIEPAATQGVVVVTPRAGARVTLHERLRVSVEWDSDVVTGATPRTYGRPDAVTVGGPPPPRPGSGGRSR